MKNIKGSMRECTKKPSVSSFLAKCPDSGLSVGAKEAQPSHCLLHIHLAALPWCTSHTCSVQCSQRFSRLNQIVSSVEDQQKQVMIRARTAGQNLRGIYSIAIPDYISSACNIVWRAGEIHTLDCHCHFLG